jgi:hypothetical protein
MFVLATFAGRSRAQGSRKDDIVSSAQGRPMAGPSMRVCTSSATGQPCTPLAEVYSDSKLTQALANPISADGLGNYNFYVAPGRYMIELKGAGITTKEISNVILPSDPSSPTFTSLTTTSGITSFSLSLTGNLTVNGSTAVVGSLTVSGQTIPMANQDNQWTAGQRFKGPIPWRDITAYMPAGGCSSTDTSDPNTTGTISNGSARLTLTAAKDFKNGCGVAVLHAGPTSTIAAPSNSCAISAVSRTSNISKATCAAPHGIPLNNIVQTAINVTGVTNGTFNVQSADVTSVSDTTHFTYVNTGANANSSGGTASTLVGYAHGVTGSTTYSYKVVAVDANMGYSAATPAITITNGNATLTRDNYNWIGFTLSRGYMFGIYSDQGLGGAYTCVGTSFTNGYSDYGMLFPCPAFLPSTPPVSAGAQTLNTTILSGGGTSTLILAASASNTATTQNVYHDESSFITSCVVDANADLAPTGGMFGCLLPAGQYSLNGPWAFSTGAQLNRMVRVFVAGGITLNTVPLIFHARSGIQASLECIGSGGSLATFAHEPNCYIAAGVNVPAVVAIEGSEVNTFSGFTANNLHGHGIWTGSAYSPITGLSVPNSYSFDRNILTEAANGAGSPMIFDGNTIGVWAKDDNLVSATSASGLPTIQFSGQSPYNNVLCCMYFDNLVTTGYGIRIDQPGGNGSGGGTSTLNFNNWLHESLPASGIALVNHDNGPNAPNSTAATAPLNSITLRNFNSSDAVLGPATTSLFAEFGSTMQISNVVAEQLAGFGKMLVCGNGSAACAETPAINGYFNVGGPTNAGAFGSGLDVNANAIGISAPLQLSLNQNNVSIPALVQLLPPPVLFAVTGTGVGGLTTATYCAQIEGVDGQSTPGVSLPSGKVCQAVGAGRSISYSWNQGNTNQLQRGFKSFKFLFCTGANCTPNQEVTANDPGACQACTYTFTTTAGAIGATLNTTPSALLSWLNWKSVNPSCLLCDDGLNASFHQLGIGEANPAAGVKLAVAGGTIQGEAGIQAGTDVAFNASPRGAYNAFLPNLTSPAATYQRMTLDKAITVTRLQLVLGTAGAGCTTQSTVSVTDGTSSVTLTTANGTAIYDSGAVSYTFGAAANLDIKIATAASDCTTAPQNANVSVQYRMR